MSVGALGRVNKSHRSLGKTNFVAFMTPPPIKEFQNLANVGRKGDGNVLWMDLANDSLVDWIKGVASSR